MEGKRKHGDRRDGKLLRKIDSMHFIMPLIMPNRCDNEAFISERIDLTNLAAYLEKKNAGSPEYKYNLFQVIVTTVLKTVTLREKMNYFIVNGSMYERNEVTAAFTIKRQFSDNGAEGLAVLHSKPTDNIDNVHEYIRSQVMQARNTDKNDASTDVMDTFNKLPRFISHTAVKFVCWLDRHGWVPASFIETDPYYTSAVLTNLGSIKLHAGYHHLTNWGTTSLFVAIGERKKRPFFDEDGTCTMRDSIDLGLTVDERIADGYYYSRTVALMRKLLENPELLELPLGEEIEY